MVSAHGNIFLCMRARRSAQTGFIMNLSVSEKLLYGGIAGMAVVAALVITGIVIFAITGRKIKRKLEEEYGKPPISQK